MVDYARYPYERRTAPVYGLSFVDNVELFVYRQELFEKHERATPPEIWGDVLQAAKTMSENELNDEIWAVSLKPDSHPAFPIQKTWFLQETRFYNTQMITKF